MSENEKFYDEEIAPALLDLCRRCNERGLSFLAAVEYGPGEVGRTSQFVEGYGLAIDNARVAILAGDNADTLIGFMAQKARETGHSSAHLFQLGVPLSPPSPSEGAK